MNRVLFIAPQPFFTTRGTPLNVREFTRFLGELALDVDLLVYPHGDDIVLTGVQIHRCLAIPGVRQVPIGFSLRKVVYDVFLCFQSLYLCLKNKYVVIHGIEEAGIIAGVLGKLFNTPYVMDFDSCIEEELERSPSTLGRSLAKLFARLQQSFVADAALVVTVAPHLSHYVRKLSPSVRIAQIEDCPLEVPAVLVKPDTGAALTSDGRITYLYTGNLEEYQGLELFYSALSLAHSVQPRLDKRLRVFVVGGEAHQVAAHQQLALELGLSNMIAFLGKRPPEEMYDLMSCADYLVSPRLVGMNTPLKLFTYMEAGRPIIATSIPAHLGVLDDTTAFISEPTPTAFSHVLLETLELREGASTLPTEKAQAARSLVEQRYSRTAFRNNIVEAYRPWLVPKSGTSIELDNVQDFSTNVSVSGPNR